ncbi:MAG: HD domain-containing protein [Lachnospiraceae bacterium]|nr:HD domain-containing protein [Lachnospiraceae bacterium]
METSWEGEEHVTSDFIYRDRLFQEAQMYTRLKAIAQDREYTEMYRALTYMREHHEGQYRKPGKHGDAHVPYINHPLMMTCHAVALGIRDDALLAAMLLHDVVEDTGVCLEELPFSEEVKTLVGLVTFVKPKEADEALKEVAKKVYYENIRKNPKACVIKVLDRCNNVSTMAQSFPRDRQIKYIKETEEYILPLVTQIKEYYPEYADIAFIVKYHIISVIETIKNLID